MDRMILGLVVGPASSHIAGWRKEGALTNVDETFEQLRDVIMSAEAEKFDFAFIADELSMPDGTAATLSRDPLVYRYEPLTLISALAAVTERIGLVVTQSTTYNEPYHIARKLASIDQLSRGRLGWNLVTSYVPEEARNFSQSLHLANVDRYERAEEFLEVTCGLWDSWDDDAFPVDRESGRYFDPEKMHRINHEGKHFSVRGPLNVRRPVQGWPVQVQAGSSEAGRELAGKYAEITFTAQNSFDAALAFTQDIKRRAEKYGRNGSQVKVLAGVQPVIGATMEEAQARYQELQELIHPEVGLARLSQLLDYDVSQLPLDEPLPEIPDTENYKSRRQLIIDMARRENLTLGELYKKVVSAYGHRVVIGTPETVADELIDWFVRGAVDGYIVSPDHLPQGIDIFNETVVPILREKGVMQREYEGATFRENLGLDRPTRGSWKTK